MKVRVRRFSNRLILVVILFFMFISNFEVIECFLRLKNADAGCNTSGILVKNAYVRFRPSSRTSQLISFGYAVENRIDSILVSLKMQIKLTMTWRQIIELKNIEGCQILSSTHPIELANRIGDFVRGLFPTSVPSSCPIKPGQYHTNNTLFDSLGKGKSSIDEAVAAFTAGKLPNSRKLYRKLYRLEAKVFNTKDPIGAILWAIAEVYERNSNETNF